MKKLSEAQTLSAKDDRVTVTRVSNKRVSIVISGEFFTNYYGDTTNMTYAFTFRKDGRWIAVNGTQELINYDVEVAQCNSK